MLFLIMINDLPDSVLNSTVSIFADDTRVTRVIRKEEHIEKLQDDINRVYEWQGKKNLLFNANKFELLRHGKTETHPPQWANSVGQAQIKEFTVLASYTLKLYFKILFNKINHKQCKKCGLLSHWGYLQTQT